MPTSCARPATHWITRIILAALIGGGISLRLVLPDDTVFCNDQARACALAADIAGGAWESAGLVNSGKFRNLPGYVYILAAVWRIWPDPQALQVFTMVANVAALLAGAWLLRRWLGRSAAWWAMAFCATAPWAVHYCRWIFAQHLMFPAALLTYAGLWAWLCRGRTAAVAVVILGLTLLVQIHLAGIVLGLAIAILLALRALAGLRQNRAARLGDLVPLKRTAIIAAGVAALVALATVFPYLRAGHLATPRAERVGLEHWWRVFGAAVMSVSGIRWDLELKQSGLDVLKAALGPRWLIYKAAALALAAWFIVAAFVAICRAILERWVGRRRLSPLGLVTALVVLIPMSFDLLTIRTSPTYLPLWYPLPFVLMGWCMVRVADRWQRFAANRIIVAGMLGAMFLSLVFFADQLAFTRRVGGYPDSILGRSFAGLELDAQRIAGQVAAEQVWVVDQRPSPIQAEAAAFLLRRQPWRPGAGRVLVHLTWDVKKREWGWLREQLRPGPDAPEGAFLVYPWHGPQQHGGHVTPIPSDTTIR